MKQDEEVRRCDKRGVIAEAVNELPSGTRRVHHYEHARSYVAECETSDRRCINKKLTFVTITYNVDG